MRRRPLAAAVAGAAASLATLAAYREIVRPWYERWGIEPGDETKLLPGDELIAAPTAGETRGITINAPEAAIWPFLVQMGFRRAGWYSYDRLDMRGRSAGTLEPRWQSIAVGETMPTWPGGGFEVVQVDPDRALVLYLDDTIAARQKEEVREVADGGAAIERMPPGLAASAAIMRTQPQRFRVSWAFILEPVDGDRTRLIERLRVEYPATPAWNRVTGPFLGAAAFLMTRKQMLGIKARAERLVNGDPATPAERQLPVAVGHQELVPV